MMKRAFIFIFGVSTIAHIAAQIPQGGEPIGWASNSKQFIDLPNVQLMRSAGEIVKQVDDGPGFNYGEQIFTDVDVLASGIWSETNNESICRFEVTSPGAKMISLQFSEYQLVEDASIFIYNADRTNFIGSFTSANNKSSGKLATAVVPGESVVVEFHQPISTTATSVLHLGSITHAYFNMLDVDVAKDYNPGYQSAACHNNVNCAVGANWQNEKRAVAMFLRPDGNGCTGLLVNNTAEDGTPYFHIANHCYTANEDEWVFYFNYETPGCSGDSGPTTQTMTGADLRSNYYFDDFALLELNNTPPANYNVYYAGWDRSGNAPTSTTAIHHPLYDVKKITFDQHTSGSYSVTPYDGAPYDIQLWSSTWDDGIVQSVSSGAPVFDQNHRLIGHVSEGSNSCDGSHLTGSGKFSESWNGSGSANRLRDWLDPTNSVMTLNGFDPNSSQAPLQLSLKVFLQGPFDSNSDLMDDQMRASAYLPISEPYTGLGYGFIGGGDESVNQGVLNTTGSNAIVDWALVELRNKNNNTQVLYSRSALVQRDGDLVDTDGSSPLSFSADEDDYYIAVRHRNHLGFMLSSTVHLSGTLTSLNLTNGSLSTYGTQGLFNSSGTYLMWSGDVNFNGATQYTGSGNDRDPILTEVGGTVPTATSTGYKGEDVNLNGVVQYTGVGNDRDIILQNIGGSVPTAIRQEQLP